MSERATARARTGWERHFVTICIGVLTAVASATAIAGVPWAMQVRDALKAIPAIQVQVATMSETVSQMQSAQGEYAARLKINNPSLRVPDPRDPSQLLGE